MEVICIYIVCGRKRARVITPPLGTHASRPRSRYTLILSQVPTHCSLILRDNLDRAIDKAYSHPQRLRLRCITRPALYGVDWLPGTQLASRQTCRETLLCPATG